MSTERHLRLVWSRPERAAAPVPLPPAPARRKVAPAPSREVVVAGRTYRTLDLATAVALQLSGATGLPDAEFLALYAHGRA